MVDSLKNYIAIAKGKKSIINNNMTFPVLDKLMAIYELEYNIIYVNRITST